MGGAKPVKKNQTKLHSLQAFLLQFFKKWTTSFCAHPGKWKDLTIKYKVSVINCGEK